MAKFYLLFFILVFGVACQNSGIPGLSQPAAEPREINPEIQKRIAAKEEAVPTGGFPRLSEMPREKPKKASSKYLAAFEGELMSFREMVLVGISGDKEQADRERLVPANIIENGRMLTLSLDDAAAALRDRILSDQLRVRDLTSKPFPALGGVPPKDQR